MDLKKILTIILLSGCVIAKTDKLYALNFVADTNNRPMAVQHHYGEMAVVLLNSLSATQKGLLYHPFNDTLRHKWQREPGQRNGLKLSDFTESQKILFHKLLRSGLSTQGYLKVTAEMFNEDIQQKVETSVGRDKFWMEIFGDPASGGFWGWKLEGHHLTLNFTLKGDKVIANTPFLIGSNPANGKTDTARAGLTILNNEDELAVELANSLTAEQLKTAYTTQKRHNIVFAEKNRQTLVIPDSGLYIKQMKPAQLAILKDLIEEYIRNFNPGETTSADVILNTKARFFFMENRSSGKEYYYRIWNGTDLIECENYGNHIHCFWRSVNDFGKVALK